MNEPTHILKNSECETFQGSCDPENRDCNCVDSSFAECTESQAGEKVVNKNYILFALILYIHTMAFHLSNTHTMEFFILYTHTTVSGFKSVTNPGACEKSC